MTNDTFAKEIECGYSKACVFKVGSCPETGRLQERAVLFPERRQHHHFLSLVNQSQGPAEHVNRITGMSVNATEAEAAPEQQLVSGPFCSP